MRNGILVGGNWIIDEVKIVDTYPEEKNLANILEQYSSNGGAAYNILKGLRKLAVDFPLEAIGLVGADERGARIIDDCLKHNIDVRQLKKTELANTSFTDVMSVKSTGNRTFFHYRGANALLNEKSFSFQESSCKIFHLGYLLLLDRLDEISADGSTGASTVLKRAKEAGLVTSVDVVSENSNRFQSVITPSLPFVDYLFLNEYESAQLSGIKTVNSKGEVLIEECIKAALKIIRMGVQNMVILHFPDGVIAVDKTLKVLFQPCVNIPPNLIVGTVGAGDAFAAGVLLGIHDNLNIEESLKLGVCAAASSLFNATSSESILSSKNCITFVETYGFKELPRQEITPPYFEKAD